MTWNDITVEQYQALYPIIKNTELDRIDQDVKIISVLLNMTEQDIYNKPAEWFRDKRKELAFLHSDEVPGRERKYLKGFKRKYRINYDLAKAPLARYAEVKTFLTREGDVIEKMHTLLASIVTPVNFFGRPQKYDDSIHEQYAYDLQGAKFIDAYNTLVFFYHAFVASIQGLRGYMVAQLSQQMTQTEAIQTIDLLCDSLSGSTTLNNWLSTKGYRQRRLGRLLRSTLSIS